VRNPGGYGQLICDDGTAVARDSYGRAVQAEHDTFTCNHCNKVVIVNAGERPEDIGGMCYMCMKLVCPHCVDAGACVPFEKKLEAIERREDALRSYGVG